MVCRYLGVDVVNIVYLTLCLLILAAGSFVYSKTKAKAPFHIGVAFGLFTVAHVIQIFGVQGNFAVTIMLVRVFAYLIVLFSLWGMRSK